MKSKRVWSTVSILIFMIVIIAGVRLLMGPSLFTPWQLPKVWVALGLALLGTVLLMTQKLNTATRIVLMVVAFFAFGVVSVLPLGDFARGMGLHPSPMCVIEKPFLFANAGRTIPIIFISIFAFVGILSIVSNKSFCGWTCPIGALQELFYKIPGTKKLKTKIPFKISNSIRFGLFAIFVLFVFTAGFSLYQYTNAFHVLHWTWSWELSIPIAIAFIGGIFIYRPFCYLVCPLGLATWALEHVSILKVRFNKQACTDCKLCLKKAPCPAVPAILEMKRSRPDCHACGVCIDVCPEDALKFRA